METIWSKGDGVIDRDRERGRGTRRVGGRKREREGGREGGGGGGIRR